MDATSLRNIKQKTHLQCAESQPDEESKELAYFLQRDTGNHADTAWKAQIGQYLHLVRTWL